MAGFKLQTYLPSPLVSKITQDLNIGIYSSGFHSLFVLFYEGTFLKEIN